MVTLKALPHHRVMVSNNRVIANQSSDQLYKPLYVHVLNF